MSAPFYKVMTAQDWTAFEGSGRFEGSALDRADGFVHLSACDQVGGTVARHFAGKPGLVLVSLDPARLAGPALRWETSRDGAAFPHYYGALTREMVLGSEPIPDDPDQRALALAMMGV